MGHAGTIHGGVDSQRQELFAAAHHSRWTRASRLRRQACKQQFKLSDDLYTQLLTLSPAVEQAGELRKQLKELQAKATGDTLTAVKALDQKLQALAGGVARRPGAGTEQPTLGGLRTRYLTLFGILQEADVMPSTQASAAVADLQKQLPPVMQRWKELQAQDVPALNKQLKNANLPEIKLQAVSTRARATVSSKDKDEE